MAYFKISKNAKGELLAKVQVSGKDLSTGKNKVFSKRIRNKENLTESKFKKYVEKLAFEFEEEIENNYKDALTNRTRILSFPELMKEWKESVKINLSHNYYLRAEDIEKKFNNYLQRKNLYNAPVNEIKVRDIQLFLNEYLEEKEVVSPYVKLIKNLPKEISMREIARDKILGRCASYKMKHENKGITKQKAEQICKRYNLKFNDYFKEDIKKFQYSKVTVKGYRRILRTVFNEAVRYEWITKNPVCFTKVSSTGNNQVLNSISEKEVFSLSEIKEFLNCLNKVGDEYIHRTIPIKIMLLTGVRNGELHGLKWSDVDIENKILKVRRSRLYSQIIGCYEKQPKTKTSVRDVPLNDYLISELKRYMDWFRLADENFDSKLDQYYIAVNIFREPINPTSLDAWLVAFEKKNKLRRVSCHGLRHTYCSMLLAQNVPIQTVSKYMGHSDSTITLKVYSHFIPDTQTLAINALNNIVNKE